MIMNGREKENGQEGGQEALESGGDCGAAGGGEGPVPKAGSAPGTNGSGQAAVSGRGSACDREARPEGVAERELVAELGLNPRHMAEIRKKRLASKDWFRWKPKNQRGIGSVYYTAEGEFKLRNWHDNRKENPGVVSKFIEAAVLGPCPNKGRVWIAVDHDGRGVTKEECAVPRALHSRLTRGKRIRVEVVRGIESTAYRHEDLATKY